MSLSGTVEGGAREKKVWEVLWGTLTNGLCRVDRVLIESGSVGLEDVGAGYEFSPVACGNSAS